MSEHTYTQREKERERVRERERETQRGRKEGESERKKKYGKHVGMLSPKPELVQCHLGCILLVKTSHRSARFKWRRNRLSLDRRNGKVITGQKTEIHGTIHAVNLTVAFSPPSFSVEQYNGILQTNAHNNSHSCF